MQCQHPCAIRSTARNQARAREALLLSVAERSSAAAGARSRAFKVALASVGADLFFLYETVVDSARYASMRVGGVRGCAASRAPRSAPPVRARSQQRHQPMTGLS